MNETYPAVLTRCMGFSALGLLTVFLGFLPPIVPFIFAMVPLIWYHLGYLRKFSGEGISQPAVDSVYYYGFLITIGALGVSALELAIKGVGGDLTQVAFQFGLGLLATGYAVWARIQLTASSSLLDEANLEEAMNRYVERSRELVSSVELATASFNNYAASIIDRTEEFTIKAQTQVNSAITASAAELREAVSGMAEESSQVLADLRELINDATFEAERKSLRASVTSMTKTVGTLSASLTELSTISSSGVIAMGSLVSGLGEVTAKSNSTASALELLGRNDGVVQSFGNAIALGQERLGEFALRADAATMSATSLSDKLSASVDGVGSFAESVKRGATAFAKLDGSSEILAEFAEELNKATLILNAAAKSAATSQSSFDDLGSRLSNLQETLRHLNHAVIDATGELKDSMIATSDALDQNFKLALERTNALANSLRAESMQKLSPTDGVANGTS